MTYLAVGVTLLWLIARYSLALYLGDVAPETALYLNSHEPRALLNLAERRLAELSRKPQQHAGEAIASQEIGRTFATPQVAPSQQSKQSTDNVTPPTSPSKLDPRHDDTETAIRAEAQALAERALAADPLNARALRILGQLAESGGDAVRAQRLYEAAAKRSLHESQAFYRLMVMAYERKDYAQALSYADTLLRTRGGAMQAVAPVLGSIAETSGGTPLLTAMLAANPPWRRAFFSGVLGAIRDARTPLGLLLSLKETSAPPTTEELRPYLDFLLSRNFHELAYYTWLQFLTPEQLANAGLLFNGGFEQRPSSLPFDWVIRTGSGVTADFVARLDASGGHALYVEFGSGRAEFGGVTEWVLLGPGAYALEGRFKGEISGRRGLKWRVTCSGGSMIGESAMFLGIQRDWKSFTSTFHVPEAGCRAQRIELILDARSASEKFVSGSAWYDDLAIRPITPSQGEGK